MILKKNKKTQIKVEVYTKKNCHLCDVVKEKISRIKPVINFDLVEVDIESDKNLYEEFKEQIPVVFINGKKAFKYRVNEDEFIKRLKRLL